VRAGSRPPRLPLSRGAYPFGAAAPDPQASAAFADAIVRPFWLDELPPRDPHPRLEGEQQADLVIVGGGFTGLWAALHAVRRDPGRSVLLLEGERCGEGASGRNGGFVDSSLTHGLENGRARFPEEIAALERIGLENFAGLREDLSRLQIAADWEETGFIDLAHQPHELEDLAAALRERESFGHDVRLLDAAGLRAEVDSPLYLGGLWDRTGAALVHPGKLVDGLRRAAARCGVRIAEHSPVCELRAEGGRMRIRTPAGAARARSVLLATGAHPPLAPAVARRVVPVYDYVLVSEPLSDAQRAALGWNRRQGLGDVGNRFHYYRLTPDGRILFGGFEAVYRYGGPVGPRWEDDPSTFEMLSRHLFTIFPQLRGLRFTHRWGGAIDTCSRFSVFFGTGWEGRVAWAAGYTGLGVAATRFGASVALDLLDGIRSEATALRLVRSVPMAFPPEPLRSAVIQLTRNRLAAADRHAGRRGLWLRTLDVLGLGFDS
jgi:glycine/D-amino acid oxidase-like deaminating enzyme